MDDIDSEAVGNLLGTLDIDDLDEQLFGRQKDKPKVVKKGISNIDDLFTDTAKEKQRDSNLISSSVNRRPTVSFLGDESVPSVRKEAKISFDDTLKAKDGKTDSTKRSQHHTFTDDDAFESRGRRGILSQRPRTAQREHLKETETDSPERITERTVDKDDSHLQSRLQRLQSEIDRLNRENDILRQKKKESEEEITEEWREKLIKKQKNFEETIEELEKSNQKQIHRIDSEYNDMIIKLKENYNKQLEIATSVQQQSKNYSDVISKMETIAERMTNITSNVSAITDKNIIEKDNSLNVKEQLLLAKEQRLRKEEELLIEERKAVKELNLKLQSLYEKNEMILLKDKWQIREERNKLNAEKLTFKDEQKHLLEMMENQKMELEASKKKFLNEQHDLLVRVVAEKSTLENEKSVFYGARDNDIRRLKIEAEELDDKLKEVDRAEQLLTKERKTYEAKYYQLIELEQTLIDECLNLEQCRKQLENIRAEQAFNQSRYKSETTDPIIDPYIRIETTGNVLHRNSNMLDQFIKPNENESVEESDMRT